MVVFREYSTVIAPSSDGYAYGVCLYAYSTSHDPFKIKGDVFYGMSSGDWLHVQKIFGVKLKMN